jgi:fibronectin type 3 domain-containing protein
MFNTIAAPANLAAVAASATGVKLTWKDNSAGESGFRIERSLYSLSGFTQVATVGANVTTYTDAGLSPNNYYYRVRAFTSSLQTPYTNVAQAVLTTSPVRMTDAVVTTCGATFLDGGLTANYGNSSNRTLVFAPTAAGRSIRVAFTTFSTEAGKDVLYVYDGGSTSAPLLNAYSGNFLPPVLTARNPEGKLTFRFVSNASVTAAGWQATVSCVTRPTAPTNLTATLVAPNQAKLTWTDNGTNETGFKIERSTYPNREFTQIATVGPNVTTYTNAGLLPNTVYYYRVRSYLDGVNTLYSNTASAINSPQVILVNKRLSESSVAVAACNAIVLDGGGTGNYQPGGQYVREIVPSTPGTKVRLVVEFADFESGDRVTILDGGKNDGKVIAEFPGEWWLPLEALATNPEGKLTVIVSNDSDTQVSSGFQGRVSCTPTSEPPIDLFATVLSSTQVKLGWTDVSATESGFKIYRGGGQNGSDLVLIATVGPNVTSYTDVNLTPNEFYAYRVRSFAGSTFESAFTPVVRVLATSRVINMQNGTVTTCDASFFDSGGPYAPALLGEDYTLTIAPATTGKMVRVKFFDIGAPLGVRYRIYDGASTSAPLIYQQENEDIGYPITFTATNPGGRLTIRFECDGLRLSGFFGEITCVSPTTAARLDAGAGAATGAAFGARLQPNPVREKLTVTLDEPARGVTRTEVTDGTGRVRLLNGHKAAGENTLELDVHALRPGLFLLYVQTDKGRRVLKFVKE